MNYSKKIIAIIMLMGMVTLSGCTDIRASVSMPDAENALIQEYHSSYQKMNDKIQSEIRERANISDSDFQEYQELQKNDQLNADGYYIEADEQLQINEDAKAEEKLKSQHKQVHVTFGTNRFIKTAYYSDAYNVFPIDTDSCYMDPGETIYAAEPIINNPNSNKYVFSEYRIYEYSEDGKERKLLATSSEGEEVFTIPNNFTGTEISVEPIGEYQSRSLNFRAYYIDSNGNEQDYSGGSWSVNGNVIEGQNVANIDPSDSYAVAYSFPANAFYCESTVPQSQKINNTTGNVVFHKYKSIDENTQFVVQLRKYSSVRIEGDIKEITSFEIRHAGAEDNTETIDDPSDDSKDILVKKNDVITIKTKDGYQTYCDQYNTGITTDVHNSEYTYELTIPDNKYSTINFRVGKSGLKVVLNKNVGKEVSFSFSGAGFNETGKHFYESGLFNLGSETTVLDKTIGIERTITVSANGGNLGSGSAYKVAVTKEAANGVSSHSISYVAVDPGKIDIEIYGDQGLTDSSKVYTQITFTISKVSIIKYEQEQIENGLLEVRLTDDTDQTILKNGDNVEPSRSIKVTIKPNNGYYVSGDDTKNGTYVSETTVGKFLPKKQSIVKDHPLKHLINVTLNDSWEYGTCIFKIDDRETEPGIYGLRPDQALTMECTLTDSTYTIERESTLPWFLADVQKTIESTIEGNKDTVTIPVQVDLDGQTVKPSDFISLKKR